RDVQGPDRGLHPAGLLDGARQAPGEGDAARAHPHEHHAAHVRVALQDLVGHAGQGPVEPVPVHELLPLPEPRGRGHQATLPPSGTGRSGMSRTLPPLPSPTARTSTWESRPATRRGGRFTTATTCSPTSSSGSYRSAIRALLARVPSTPKSRVSAKAGRRAP